MTLNLEIATMLLEIAKYFPADGDSSEGSAFGPGENRIHATELPGLQELLKKLKQHWSFYTNRDEELVIIAMLFAGLLDGHASMPAHTIANRIYSGSSRRIELLLIIGGMRTQGLVSLGRYERLRVIDSRPYPELFEIIMAEIHLSTHILNAIVGTKVSWVEQKDTPYLTNAQFLAGAVEIGRAYVLRNEVDDQFRRIRKLHRSRAALSRTRFPLQRLAEEEGLDEIEQNILIALLLVPGDETGLTPAELARRVPAESDLQDVTSRFELGSKLVNRGLIEHRMHAPDFEYLIRLAHHQYLQLLDREP